MRIGHTMTSYSVGQCQQSRNRKHPGEQSQKKLSKRSSMTSTSKTASLRSMMTDEGSDDQHQQDHCHQTLTTQLLEKSFETEEQNNDGTDTHSIPKHISINEDASLPKSSGKTSLSNKQNEDESRANTSSYMHSLQSRTKLSSAVSVSLAHKPDDFNGPGDENEEELPRTMVRLHNLPNASIESAHTSKRTCHSVAWCNPHHEAPNVQDASDMDTRASLSSMITEVHPYFIAKYLFLDLLDDGEDSDEP